MNERSTVSNAEAEVTANGTLRRNYYLGLLNGMFANLGNRILSPQLVLTAFVYDLTGSNFLAGLLNSLSMAGQRFPQIYMSSLIEHRENRKRFYVAASVVRIVLLALMAGTIFLTGAGFGIWAMVAFFVVYFAFRSAQGCASIPFWDVLAGTVGPTRVGGFLGQRHFLGNAVTMIVAPLVVQPVLSAQLPGFARVASSGARQRVDVCVLHPLRGGAAGRGRHQRDLLDLRLRRPARL